MWAQGKFGGQLLLLKVWENYSLFISWWSSNSKGKSMMWERVRRTAERMTWSRLGENEIHLTSVRWVLTGVQTKDTQ